MCPSIEISVEGFPGRHREINIHFTLPIACGADRLLRFLIPHGTLGGFWTFIRISPVMDRHDPPALSVRPTPHAFINGTLHARFRWNDAFQNAFGDDGATVHRWVYSCNTVHLSLAGICIPFFRLSLPPLQTLDVFAL